MDQSTQASLLRIQNMVSLCQQLKLPVQFKVGMLLLALELLMALLLLLLVLLGVLCPFHVSTWLLVSNCSHPDCMLSRLAASVTQQMLQWQAVSQRRCCMQDGNWQS